MTTDCYYYTDEYMVEDFYFWAKEFKHTEGVLAGENIELDEFQLYMAAAVLCFKKKDNSARLVRKCYIQLARKNAKSQFEAILGSYLAFLSEEKQRMYIAGWSRDQSTEVYTAVRDGLGSSPLLEGKWKETYGTIKVIHNNSEIVPLSREARKVGDGKNPSVVIVDEYHAHKTSEIYDVLISGMVARKEPLMVIITTAGFDLSAPCYEEYRYVSQILDSENDMENDAYFVLICELDPEDDFKNGGVEVWRKANPIVCSYKEGVESIKQELQVALAQPEKMRNFLTKNMNIWVDMKTDSYIPLNRWNECEIEEQPDLETYNLYLGLDLSMTTDITSVGLVGVHNGNYYVEQHSFMPSEKFNERISRDRVRYDVWRDLGFLTVTEGDVVDYKEVFRWIVAYAEKHHYQVKQIGFDKWNATHLALQLEEEGFEMIEVPQRITHLSIPTKEFREKVFNKKVTHLSDPMLRWAVNNCVLKIDEQENVMIGKKVSVERIDPVAAIINAYSLAMYDENRFDINERIEKADFSF